MSRAFSRLETAGEHIASEQDGQLERAARSQSNCAGPVPAPLPTGCRSCTNDINRFEALSRWRHPNLGATVPGTFIPLAEEIGLIVRLGEWVVREACATAVLWPGDLRVAVNLSVAQSKNSGPRLSSSAPLPIRDCGPSA